MDKRIKYIFLFWLVLIIGFISYKEIPFLFGCTVKLIVSPVDPVDIFRGNYVNLNYEISNINIQLKDIDTCKDNIYITLKNDKNNISHYAGYSCSKPDNNNLFIKGKYYSKYCDKTNCDIKVEYGFENYFTNKYKAKSIEETANKSQYALINIDKMGNARLLKIIK